MWRRAASSVETAAGPVWAARLLDSRVEGSDKFALGLPLRGRGALTGGMQVPLESAFSPVCSSTSPFAAWRYEYFDRIRGKETVFSTPGVFGDAGLALGMSLR